MMKFRHIALALAAVLCFLSAGEASAQVQLSEDFTGPTSSNTGGVGNWLVSGGACLTAGNVPVAAVGTIPSSIPACIIQGSSNDVLHTYYQQQHSQYAGDSYLIGGENGYLGSSSSGTLKPDDKDSGALRFTNGWDGTVTGHGQNGTILSSNAYPSNGGIQVTFKTVTYGGDGDQGTGADGLSFFLLDGCMPVAGAIVPTGCPATPNAAYGKTTYTAGSTYPTAGAFAPNGAWGGSLAYTCSNSNTPYDGLVGAYLGLGIDEFGNFVNGSTYNSNTKNLTYNGDNTASGLGRAAPSTIGLRGAGSISWQALSNAYGTDPGNSKLPYYPSILYSCNGGAVYDTNIGQCVSCPSGSYAASTTSGQTGTCTVTTTTYSCSTGTQVGSGASSTCVSCPSGYTYNAGYGYGGAYCSKNNGNGWTSVQYTNPTQSTTTSSGGAPTTSTATTSSTSTANLEAMVLKTCQTGHLWNYKNPSSPTDAGAAVLSTSNGGNTANILDYPYMASQSLSGVTIYSQEKAKKPQRGSSATNVLLYNLKITPAGLLSLSYSVNGGAYNKIISNQSITASNGPLPTSVRYGFAGSTGGGSNVHEVLCFKSQPVNQAQSSAGVNQRQSAEIQPTGSFAYFSFYDTLDWAGRLTANALSVDSGGNLLVNQVPTWDASCVLSGPTAPGCDASEPYTVAQSNIETPDARLILTWNPGSGTTTAASGANFSTDGISTTQLTNLNWGDPTSDGNRLAFLRGDRTNELTVPSGGGTPTCGQYVASNAASSGRPCFRARDSVLGDIIDSSPVWVGPPQLPYTATWTDRLNASTTQPEMQSGAQTYQAFTTLMQSRTNVVYVGANDGMLHGFRSGAFTSTGAFDSSASNDGREVLAYLPGSVLQSTLGTGTTSCANLPNPMAVTKSSVQNIHGITPDSTGSVDNECTASSLDFSHQNYGHNFFVDATPGTGDLFYNGAWHTWVVGGMGPGGAAIFALDVTNPSASAVTATSGVSYPAFSVGNAANLVIGEWTPATLSCANNTATNAANCGNDLGNTYGTPIIRRLHDGKWAVIFGNGFGSASGDAGVYVMTIGWSGTQVSTQTYYLSTNTAGSANGIAYVTSADLDGDHVTDYLYAGDLEGNVWRFDLTSRNESDWSAGAFKLFTTQSGQPITTALTVSAGVTGAGPNMNTIMIGFGTGQKTQVSNLTQVSYANAKQSLYGVWDWNMAAWNALSARSTTPTQYASLSGSGAPTGALDSTKLAQQGATLTNSSISGASNDEVDQSSANPICWVPSTGGCTAQQFGWYLNLPGSSSTTLNGTTTTNYEQIVYSPLVEGAAFVVNSTIPASNSTLSCTTQTDTGFTYAVTLMGGGYVPNFFNPNASSNYHNSQAVGVETNATGTSFPVRTANGANWLVYQTVGNTPSTLQVNLAANYVGKRLTWVQLR